MLSVLLAAPAANAPALVSVAVSVRSYTLSLAAAPLRVMAFCPTTTFAFVVPKLTLYVFPEETVYPYPAVLAFRLLEVL